MELYEKYLVGTIIAVVIVVVFNPFSFVTVQNPLPFLIIGITLTAVGILFYILLFSPERIKGHKMEFEAAPDLSSFRIVSDKTSTKEELPETAFCGVCGQEIYKPFQCHDCGQLLCGKHYLPGDHECRRER
jgi:hypothetical protein